MAAYALLLPAFGCVFLAICAVAYHLTRDPERSGLAQPLFSGALGMLPGLIVGNVVFWTIVGVVRAVTWLLFKMFPEFETSLHEGAALNLLLFAQFMRAGTGVWLTSALGAAAGFRIGAARAPMPLRPRPPAPSPGPAPEPEPEARPAGMGRRSPPPPPSAPIPLSDFGGLGGGTLIEHDPASKPPS